MPQTAVPVSIRTIPFHHSIRLHGIFDRALESDFAYFSPQYRQTVRVANRPTKMLLATVHPRRLMLGAYHNSELIGYSMSGIQTDGIAFLFWLFVAPNFRSQSIGRELLMQTEQNLRKRSVDSIQLITHNQQAFYERHGFEMQKMLHGLVAGVDMYAMQKSLA